MITITEFLELDPRPTFALDLDSNTDAVFNPCFLNAALRDNQQLMHTLPFKPTPSSQPTSKPHQTEFERWLAAIISSANASPSYTSSGILWTAIRIKKWVVISGNHITDHVVLEPPIIGQSLSGQSTSSQSTSSDAGNAPSVRRTEIYKKEDTPKPRRTLSNENDHAGTLLDHRQGALATSFTTPGTPDVGNGGAPNSHFRMS